MTDSSEAPAEVNFAGARMMSTMLTLLTPAYQQRMVQQAYHGAVDNAPQWPAQYCWPEGFMRRWHYHAVTNQPHSVIVTPTLVQFLAGDVKDAERDRCRRREFVPDGRDRIEGVRIDAGHPEGAG